MSRSSFFVLYVGFVFLSKKCKQLLVLIGSFLWNIKEKPSVFHLFHKCSPVDYRYGLKKLKQATLFTIG